LADALETPGLARFFVGLFSVSLILLLAPGSGPGLTGRVGVIFFTCVIFFTGGGWSLVGSGTIDFFCHHRTHQVKFRLTNK